MKKVIHRLRLLRVILSDLCGCARNKCCAVARWGRKVHNRNRFREAIQIAQRCVRFAGV
jgi:hypothetical protein